MTENWINENLCSLGDDTVRIERGPQIIELDCNDQNLDNSVTHPNYKIGSRDALGRIIRPDDLPESDEAEVEHKRIVNAVVNQEQKRGVCCVVNNGEKMFCVDWKAKHVPYLWKVYKLQDSGEVDKEFKPIFRFVKVHEVEGVDEALNYARGIV